MRIVRGHYDGQRVVLDEPVPEDIHPPAPVRILFDGDSAETLIDRLGRLAEGDDLPADYSEQHDHYVKGTPRK